MKVLTVHVSSRLKPHRLSPYQRGVGLNVLAGLGVVGDVAAITALALWATATQSPAYLMFLLLADALPGVFLGYVGGKILDSLNTPRLWIAGLAAQAGLYIFLALHLTTTTVLIVTALSSTISVLYGAAAFVHGQRLVGPDGPRLAKNNSILTTSGSFIGLALTGLIYTSWGIQTCLLVNAATFTISMMVVPALLLTHKETNTPPETRLGEKDHGHDTNHIRDTKQAHDTDQERDPHQEHQQSPKQHSLISAFGISGLTVVFATVLATSIDSVSGYFVVLEIMKLPPAEFTTASAVWSLCVVAGAAMLKSRPTDDQQRGATTMSQCSAIMGLSLLGVAVFLPNFVGLVVLYMIGGIANGAFNTAMSVRISQGTSQTHQGRAWGIMRALVNGALISGMAISGVATAWSSRATMSAAGILPIVIWVTYMIWLQMSRMRQRT